MRTYFARIPQTLIMCIMMMLISCLFAVCSGSAASAKKAQTECNIHEGACSLQLTGRTVALEISPRPVRAMADLTFRVTVSGPPLSGTPHIDLGMPGMEMGPNRVNMEKTGENTYTGNGVIVRCPSGKTTWRAAVTVPETGTAAFVFDVVY
ncbi:MAG: hypothetical protein KGY56_14205 [Desulfobacterales bacterium]|nr:hypothetical protein [Desulfobacterales bacterium]